jgi:hypothetical protein
LYKKLQKSAKFLNGGLLNKKQEIVKSFLDIREHDQYILRNTIRAGCIHECWLFFNELAKGAGSDKVRGDLADGSEDCSRFFMQLSQKNESLPKVTAQSKGKLIRNTVSTLQDFGLATGKKHRVISRPPVVPRTAFHLVRLLTLEGLSGKEIMAARDWRIFLRDQQDISRMLARLSQEKWIRYEKSGNIVNVEICTE